MNGSIGKVFSIHYAWKTSRLSTRLEITHSSYRYPYRLENKASLRPQLVLVLQAQH